MDDRYYNPTEKNVVHVRLYADPDSLNKFLTYMEKETFEKTPFPEVSINVNGMITALFRYDEYNYSVEFSSGEPTGYLWTKYTYDHPAKIIECRMERFADDAVRRLEIPVRPR